MLTAGFRSHSMQPTVASTKKLKLSVLLFVYFCRKSLLMPAGKRSAMKSLLMPAGKRSAMVRSISTLRDIPLIPLINPVARGSGHNFEWSQE